MMLELVREKEHNTSGAPEMNHTVKKKSLCKSSLDETAATLQELFLSMPQAFYLLLTLPVRQEKPTTASASSLEEDVLAGSC
ncbi:hypothetical protein E2C01_093014 [Portunus trituberculatus]|uniref:Uncharacterized protein n=1 Tax=Portunus trituberculatus TaxID=210409 RepID=A0A5B7JXI1_PORTR|nr:hypothetical protein [Portunus trituberculatus]